MGRVGDGARMSKTNMVPAIVFVGLGQLLPTHGPVAQRPWDEERIEIFLHRKRRFRAWLLYTMYHIWQDTLPHSTTKYGKFYDQQYSQISLGRDLSTQGKL